MNSLEDIPNRLRSISAEVLLAARIAPGTNNLGWGQFVDAPAHSHQIGAYGTCAAILTLMAGDPGHPIDARIAAQVDEFWRGASPGALKLRSQNIRLAFLVLCLAGTVEPTLAAVLQEAINELRGRQMNNGAWGDWAHQSEAPQARSETTAWVALALARAGPGDPHAIRGAEYLLTEINGAASSKRLSPIAVGAALTILPENQISGDLIRQAKMLLGRSQAGDGEAISFFDFVEGQAGASRIARDYLCFPEIYALTLVLRGLHKHGSWPSVFGNALRRLEVADVLLNLVEDGRPYKLRGAKFAATVDQAMIALAYENLRECKSKIDPFIQSVRPLFAWLRENLVVRVVVPIAFLALAAATMEEVKTLAELMNFVGLDSSSLNSWLTSRESVVRVSVAIFLILTPWIPLSVLNFVRRKISA